MGIGRNDYGNSLGAKGDFDGALDFLNFALRASNTYAPAILNNAAGFLKDSGRLDEGIATYQHALRLKPNFDPAYNGLLLSLHYKMTASTDLASAHLGWGSTQTTSIAPPLSYPNTPRPERNLRIGFVSGDFGVHPVGMFLVRYLENMNRDEFTCYCYATTPRDDRLTVRLRQASTHWSFVHTLSNAQLFQKIQADGIDILIDLSGHTAENRLAVFARKPAPIQIGWLGYPGDNGLPTMDYIIGDRFVLPKSMPAEKRRKFLHLPDSFVCFDPPSDAPSITALPATVRGEITFGCFHNPAKCSSNVVKLWAHILAKLPRAKLLLKYKGFGNPSTQQRFLSQFQAAGIDAARLEFQGESSFAEMYEAISRVDLALDPFPFSGGLMTCMALWMGVPVITLPGESFASRQGLSLLSSVGMTETIATSAEDYCNKAIGLANDLKRLAILRQKLRPMMSASPLCDGSLAAKSLQNLLRRVWQDWCENR